MPALPAHRWVDVLNIQLHIRIHHHELHALGD